MKSSVDPVSEVKELVVGPKKSLLSERSTGFAELPEAISRLESVNWTTSMLVRVSMPSPATLSVTVVWPAGELTATV